MFGSILMFYVVYFAAYLASTTRWPHRCRTSVSANVAVRMFRSPHVVLWMRLWPLVRRRGNRLCSRRRLQIRRIRRCTDFVVVSKMTASRSEQGGFLIGVRVLDALGFVQHHRFGHIHEIHMLQGSGQTNDKAVDVHPWQIVHHIAVGLVASDTCAFRTLQLVIVVVLPRFRVAACDVRRKYHSAAGRRLRFGHRNGSFRCQWNCIDHTHTVDESGEQNQRFQSEIWGCHVARGFHTKL